MPNVLNTLYPPQFPSTFADAFPTTASPRIYFSISSYNSANIIRRVHVQIVNQTSNENVINNSTGILFKDLNFDSEVGLYYVDISVTEIKSSTTTSFIDSSGNVVTNTTTTSGWNYNQYYKLQLRFDNNETGVVNNSDYFIANLEHFSEWSQVLLLRPILQPEILIRPFDLSEDSQTTLAFNKGIVHLSGFMSFGDGASDETETMDHFQIQILQNVGDVVLTDSGVIYTNNSVDPNAIDYLLDLAGLDTDTNNLFKLRIIGTTKNNYTVTNTYNFSIADYIVEANFNPTLTVDLDSDNGTATLHINNPDTVFGTLYIRRSSSLSDFKDWEVIREVLVNSSIDDMQVVDNTVGSGIWYRYNVQLENSVGGLTQVYQTSLFFPDFYDAIFSRGDKQIKIRYNYSISSMRPVVNRQKIDTLGGRYPKFVENAAMNYKQFSISGLISTQEDEAALFLDKEEYYGDMYENLEVYEEENYSSDYMRENYNYLWEREFREELVKWLNDGEPKLYRSMTEGLMVVMVTDVSLTPNATLSRRLYNFSATVYEIADGNSLETLNTLGVYDVITPETDASTGGGDEPTPEYRDVSVPGQIYQERVSDMVDGKVDIVSNVILTRLQSEYAGVLSNRDPRDLYIKHVKIWFLSKPHIFLQNSSGIHLIDDPTQYTESERRQMILGYTFEVNNQSESPSSSSIFFVPERGYYQIPDSIDVSSLFFPQDDDIILLEYIICYKETNATGSQISSSTVERTVIGQQRGIFDYGERLGDAIRRKYSYVVPNSYYQQMQWWRGICVDVNSYAIVNIQYQDEDDFNEYVVGFTGVLHMLQDCNVQDMYFAGRRMSIVDASEQPFLKPYECVLDTSVTTNTASTFSLTPVPARVSVASEMEGINSGISLRSEDIAIEEPKTNTIYQINGQNYIYYSDGEWYPVSSIDTDSNTAVVQVPIEGIVSYYGDVIRNTYGV